MSVVSPPAACDSHWLSLLVQTSRVMYPENYRPVMKLHCGGFHGLLPVEQGRALKWVPRNLPEMLQHVSGADHREEITQLYRC